MTRREARGDRARRARRARRPRGSRQGGARSKDRRAAADAEPRDGGGRPRRAARAGASASTTSDVAHAPRRRARRVQQAVEVGAQQRTGPSLAATRSSDLRWTCRFQLPDTKPLAPPLAGAARAAASRRRSRRRSKATRPLPRCRARLESTTVHHEIATQAVLDATPSSSPSRCRSRDGIRDVGRGVRLLDTRVRLRRERARCRRRGRASPRVRASRGLSSPAAAMGGAPHRARRPLGLAGLSVARMLRGGASVRSREHARITTLVPPMRRSSCRARRPRSTRRLLDAATPPPPSSMPGARRHSARMSGALAPGDMSARATQRRLEHACRPAARPQPLRAVHPRRSPTRRWPRETAKASRDARAKAPAQHTRSGGGARTTEQAAHRAVRRRSARSKDDVTARSFCAMAYSWSRDETRRAAPTSKTSRPCGTAESRSTTRALARQNPPLTRRWAHVPAAASEFETMERRPAAGADSCGRRRHAAGRQGSALPRALKPTGEQGALQLALAARAHLPSRARARVRPGAPPRKPPRRQRGDGRCTRRRRAPKNRDDGGAFAAAASSLPMPPVAALPPSRASPNSARSFRGRPHSSADRNVARGRRARMTRRCCSTTRAEARAHRAARLAARRTSANRRSTRGCAHVAGRALSRRRAQALARRARAAEKDTLRGGASV